LGVVVAAILAVTLSPVLGEAPRPPHWCAGCDERGVAHVVLNVILFMPLGALLALTGVPRRWSWLSGGLLSALVESAQVFIPGRDASVDDVLTNTTGTILGWLVAVAVLGWLRRSPSRPHSGPALATAVAVLLVVAATGLLLAPSFPRDLDYYGRWTPHIRDLEPYRGQVLRAELGSLALPPTRLADTPRLRSLLLAGGLLHVRAVAGPPVEHFAPLFAIYDGAAREVVLLGLAPGDVVLRYRTRGYAWGFDHPPLRLRGGARGLAPGDTLDLAMWREPEGRESRVCLRLNARHACGLGFSPARGWGNLYSPDSFPEWLRRLLDVSWIGGLLFVVGFVSRGGRAGLLVAGGVGLLGLALLPLWVGLLEPSPLEWLAALAGLAAGALAWTSLARRAQITAPQPPPST